MYLVSSHGQGTSDCPGASGAPTECTHLTNRPRSPRRSQTCEPERVMICIETATYSESVICTPNFGSSEPSGPMQNAITYIVRPAIAPRYSSVMIVVMSTGSIQLLVGPASDASSEQMNVRSSTRATSAGSETAQNEFGLPVSGTKVPLATSCLVNRSHSARDPSHHTTLSGSNSSAISATHNNTPAWVVGAGANPGTACAAPVISTELATTAPHRSSRTSTTNKAC
ncbi:Uncharacterised protein [Mycobacteroides abscessus subsp. bolletii]|nr:Uncharacterised protein [Mycobacteroides abscessus subsp. abscessus]SKG71276.1 Uncharacterised protein [Mycobacteroides abscessus subsp. bolletii]